MNSTEQYGVYESGESGGEVTITADFSDVAEEAGRDDGNDPSKEHQLKVVELISLDADKGDDAGTVPSSPDPIPVKLMKKSSGAVEITANLDADPTQNKDEWDEISPHFSLSVNWSSSSGDEGTTRETGVAIIKNKAEISTETTGYTLVTASLGSTVKKIIIGVIDLQITHPLDTNGDGKVNDAENEFSFDSSDPGILSITCSGTGGSGIDGSKLRWTMDAVGNSTLSWSSHVEGDTAIGSGASTNAVFTGMPGSNSDFGKKTVTLSYDGLSVTETVDIEVFFDPLARNNNGPEPDDFPDNVNIDDLTIVQ
jgi:hypothetical protein